MNTISTKSIKLSDVGINQKCIIKEVNTNQEEKLRLYDLGFMPNSQIVPMYVSFLNSTKAYFVKGSLIALRKEYSDCINVVEEKEVLFEWANLL